ncbi:MAG: HPr kinase/phosphatase C-terminal domain-containing protein [Rhodobacteraceae bacterium]|nr:HPr kinase/phosphatase C-terminal domain-containing protein [Paracoccaceae bacterium]
MVPVDSPQILHATCVAVDGRAVLILGPSGSGKSSLALSLMALGARLVADDRTIVRPGPDAPVADCPPAIRGRIEARGVGILAADPAPPTPIALVVDLGQPEPDRLPPWRTCTIAGHAVPLVQNCGPGPFAAAIAQYLRGGRID